MELINAGMRKGIKKMAYACQVAQMVSLMPKPKDFVTRLVGDVVYLSASLNKLSVDMNRLLDSYAEIPTNYLMTQVNSITGSLMSITDRLNIYGKNAVNQTYGLAENATKTITELTGSVIDTTGALTTAIISLGGEVAHASSAVLGDTDTAEDIHDATTVILEWTQDGFQTVSEESTAPLRKATQNMVDARTGLTNKMDNQANATKDNIDEKRMWVDTLVSQLRDKMAKLASVMDSNFKDVTGMTSISRGASMVTQALKESGNDSLSAQATTAIASSLATVINNFSIGKMVFAFAGVLSQSGIVKLGLDQLPPIDFESMLYKIRNDMTISVEELHKQYDTLLESTYNDYAQWNDDSSNENVNFSSENYDKFIAEYNGRLKELRDNIRLMMKNKSTYTRDETVAKAADTLVKRELRSAIKEVQKYRKQVNNARQANTLKSIIGDQLLNFKKEAEYRCNTLKADWKSMMDQYKKAINEIKNFFTNGGSCDMFIEDCCKAINKDFNDIKELCSSLKTQLVGSAVKIIMPADIGAVVPNPIYKIADFWLDIKTIIKFIKDLITLIIDIINNINKLARIMLNGINNLTEIIKQLMDIIGLKWLMNLVQSIIDFFGDNILDARERLINTLSPVHFSETEEYNHCMEALDKFLEEGVLEDISDVDKMLDALSVDRSNKKSKEISKLKDALSSVKNIKTINDSNSEKIEELIEDLEDHGDEIVAYKSPIIEQTSMDETTVAGLVDGGRLNNDVKFIGWYFFHPNLGHTEDTYYKSKIKRRIKSKIIKRASKTGHKKSGGVNKLWHKNVGRKPKVDKAFVAFYWYTYYTEDLEKDCFDLMTEQDAIIVDSVIQTENGSVVELSDGRKVFVADNMVRSGDYVNVEGVKYRVK